MHSAIDSDGFPSSANEIQFYLSVSGSLKTTNLNFWDES